MHLTENEIHAQLQSLDSVEDLGLWTRAKQSARQAANYATEIVFILRYQYK